jgi:hypothetical protein
MTPHTEQHSRYLQKHFTTDQRIKQIKDRTKATIKELKAEIEFNNKTRPACIAKSRNNNLLEDIAVVKETARLTIERLRRV